MRGDNGEERFAGPTTWPLLLSISLPLHPLSISIYFSLPPTIISRCSLTPSLLPSCPGYFSSHHFFLFANQQARFPERRHTKRAHRIVLLFVGEIRSLLSSLPPISPSRRKPPPPPPPFSVLCGMGNHKNTPPIRDNQTEG